MEQAKYKSRDEIFQIFLDEIVSSARRDIVDFRRTIKYAVEDYQALAGKHPNDLDKDQLLLLLRIVIDEASITTRYELDQMLLERKEDRLDQMEERNGEG